MSHEILPEPTLRRLPWYLAYVSLLHSRGVEYVSSTAIARELNVDASQIAKDLSFLSIRGKTRIGYEVAELEKELKDFLGFDSRHNAVIMGVGSLGAALISDSGLARYGLNVVAGFDVNPRLIGSTINGIPVFSPEELPERREEFNAEIGIITVPVEVAQGVADDMVAAGIRALWNFTPVRIRTAEGIAIENTSIYAHLAVMYNRLDDLRGYRK
ncbi:MAG: redox-sensing transcriptional repressor Rex [Bacteroides sp.]|nr:redox-sensing transcriptional repressor Rex [Bacteroidales bacterium]MBD5242581.1 redox-sensing transcriptional repressor Rex [Barnesiella sp.]MBD5315086.1 redox-sensing transcriptional repressor Rex [Bacteroides sp.]